MSDHTDDDIDDGQLACYSIRQGAVQVKKCGSPSRSWFFPAEDVKVVEFDNIRQSNWKSYDLTTVGMDIHQRVRALVRLIRSRLKEPDAPDLYERVETRLIVRGTVI